MPPTAKSWSPMLWIAAGFLVVSIAARFVPHLPNMTPVTALALFAGAWLPVPLALPLALGGLFIGDVALGWVAQNLMGYLAIALTVALGAWLRARQRPLVIGGAALSGSLVFFILSNFGVWLEGVLYPRTWDGLVACFAAGVPFYRHQLIGDLVATALLFGGFAVVCRWCGRPAPIPVSVRH